MKNRKIKLAVVVLLTGFVFALTACNPPDKNTGWQSGVANQFKNTKFAPDLHEVLPDSAANLLLEGGAGHSLPRAFAGTQAGVERLFSPDLSWLKMSPSNLRAGYNFARGGEYVIDMFEYLGGQDGEIRSRVDQAIIPLLAGYIDVAD